MEKKVNTSNHPEISKKICKNLKEENRTAGICFLDLLQSKKFRHVA